MDEGKNKQQEQEEERESKSKDQTLDKNNYQKQEET